MRRPRRWSVRSGLCGALHMLCAGIPRRAFTMSTLARDAATTAIGRDVDQTPTPVAIRLRCGL